MDKPASTELQVAIDKVVASFSLTAAQWEAIGQRMAEACHRATQAIDVSTLAVVDMSRLADRLRPLWDTPAPITFTLWRRRTTDKRRAAFRRDVSLLCALLGARTPRLRSSAPETIPWYGLQERHVALVAGCSLPRSHRRRVVRLLMEGLAERHKTGRLPDDEWARMQEAAKGGY